SLAAGTPVGDSGRFAPWRRADDGAAPAAGTPRSAVDVAERPRALDASAHRPVRGDERLAQLVVGDFRERTPRRHPRLPESLRLPEISDARHEALIEDGVADGARARIGTH